MFVYDAAGQLVAEYSTQIETEAPKVSYLTTDHLGSPRIATNAAGGVISRKDFTAFGEEVVTAQRVSGDEGNGYDPPNVRQDYTGYKKDLESGLEFAQARYYNTRHGRFTSVDPLTASATIRNPQTLNRYSYVINSPYKFVDPLGLSLQDIGVQQTNNPYEARWLANNSVYLQQKAVEPPPPPVKVVRIKKTYDVAGATAADAMKDANAKAKAGETKNGEAGETLPSFDVDVDKSDITETSTTDPQTGTVTSTLTVNDLAVTVTIVTTLPEWSDKDKATKKERDKWDKAVAKLEKHEEKHAQVAINLANKFRQDINGSSATGRGANAAAAREIAGGTLSRQGSSVMDRMVKEYNRITAAQDAGGKNLFKIRR